MTFQTFFGRAFVLYCFHIFSCLAGIYILDRLAWGNIQLDFKADLRKLAVCSLFELGVPLAIYYFAPNPRVAILYFLLFWVITKFVYLGINIAELAVLTGVNICGFFIFSKMVKIIPLGVFYIFIFLALAALLAMHIKEKKTRGELALKDRGTELRIRDLARRDPGFQTFCSNCLQFNRDVNYCRRKINKQKVKDIVINGKQYCAYWEKDETGV